jgi:hypothetical protein
LETSTVKPILKNQADRTIFNESPAVNPIMAEQIYEIVEMGRNILETVGKYEHSTNHYNFKYEGNTLTVARSESQEVILQVTDNRIEINNLTRLDVERFNIAAEAKDEDRRNKERQIGRDKIPDMER